MDSSRRLFLTLALLVVVWYLAVSLLPARLGSCLDGECGFTPAEMLVSVLIPVGLAAIPVVAEMALYKKSLGQALSAIGLSRFSPDALPITLVYLLPLAVFFPLFSLITGSPLALRPHWGWLVLGAALNNGLTEETMMRGFVYRHLKEGRAFWRAAWLSTLYFAGYHLVLVFTLGPLLGIISTLSAIPTGLFTAYLYQRGRQTVWAPILMHAGNNALAFIFTLSPEIQPIAASLYLLVSILWSLILTLWAYRGGFERAVVTVPASSAN